MYSFGERFKFIVKVFNVKGKLSLFEFVIKILFDLMFDKINDSYFSDIVGS